MPSVPEDAARPTAAAPSRPFATEPELNLSD